MYPQTANMAPDLLGWSRGWSCDTTFSLSRYFFVACVQMQMQMQLFFLYSDVTIFIYVNVLSKSLFKVSLHRKFQMSFTIRFFIHELQLQHLLCTSTFIPSRKFWFTVVLQVLNPSVPFNFEFNISMNSLKFDFKVSFVSTFKCPLHFHVQLPFKFLFQDVLLNLV